MLKAVIIDPSAVARGLLNTVLLDGGYDVVGATHTCASAMVQLIKHQPHIVCVAREQIEKEEDALREIRSNWPKTLCSPRWRVPIARGGGCMRRVTPRRTRGAS